MIKKKQTKLKSTNLFAKPYLHAIQKFSHLFLICLKIYLFLVDFSFIIFVLPKKILTWKHNLYLMFNLHKLILILFSVLFQTKTTENH